MDLRQKHKVLESNKDTQSRIADLRYIPHSRASKPVKTVKKRSINEHFEVLRDELCGPRKKVKINQITHPNTTTTNHSTGHGRNPSNSLQEFDHNKLEPTNPSHCRISSPLACTTPQWSPSAFRSVSTQPAFRVREPLPKLRPLTSTTQLSSSEKALPFSSNPHKLISRGRLTERDESPVPALDFGMAFLGQLPRASQSMLETDHPQSQLIRTPLNRRTYTHGQSLQIDYPYISSNPGHFHAAKELHRYSEDEPRFQSVHSESDQLTHDSEDGLGFQYSKSPAKTHIKDFSLHKKPLYAFSRVESRKRLPLAPEAQSATGQADHATNRCLDNQRQTGNQSSFAKSQVPRPSTGYSVVEGIVRDIDSISTMESCLPNTLDCENEVVVPDSTISEDRLGTPVEQMVNSHHSIDWSSSQCQKQTTSPKTPALPSALDISSTRKVSPETVRACSTTSPLFNPTSTFSLEPHMKQNSSVKLQLNPEDFVNNFFSSDGVLTASKVKHCKTSSISIFQPRTETDKDNDNLQIQPGNSTNSGKAHQPSEGDKHKQIRRKTIEELLQELSDVESI